MMNTTTQPTNTHPIEVLDQDGTYRGRATSPKYAQIILDGWPTATAFVLS
jgi:hypothetical protein